MTFVWDTSGNGALTRTGTNHKERRRYPSFPVLRCPAGASLVARDHVCTHTGWKGSFSASFLMLW